MFVLQQNGRKQTLQTLVLVYFVKKLQRTTYFYSETMEALILIAKEWSGLDRYGFVFFEVDWEKGT